MAQQNLYQEISTVDHMQTNIVVTVLDGENAGEKSLFRSEEAGVCVPADSSMKPYHKEILALRGAGLTNVGGVNIYYEQLSAAKRLVLCGAGHVATALTTIGAMTGYEVTVIEDREEFAKRAQEAGAHQVICDDFSHALDGFESDEDTYFVVMTREHLFDLDCLRRILPLGRAYVGLMGSRRKAALIREKLLAEGFSLEDVEAIHMPIGLSIGAQTPQEIAISVISEIIQVCHQKHRSYGYPTEIMAAILKAQEKHVQTPKWMLATVIEKNGSAPRGVSTKMVIRPDGTLVGTIGGGSPEAQVIQKALDVAGQEHPKPMILSVDMSVKNFLQELMVCGGTVKVLIEAI